MKGNRHLYIFFTLSIVVILSSVRLSHAQNFRQPTNGRQTFGQNQLTNNSQFPNSQTEQDSNQDTTTKPPKVRKPLESFYFDDSTRQERIFSWTVSTLNNDITRQPIDTLLQYFNIDYGFMRKDVGNIYLGNVGSATIPINYFRRETPQNFSFVDGWSQYMMTPEQVLFYNSKTPYSRLSYEMSGVRQVEENLFNIILAHNVSPSTSFNVEYKANATKGQFKNQKTLARYVSASFAHTGKKYAVHGGYIYNHGEIFENGGIQRDKDVTDTVYSRQDEIPVNLLDASNTYRGHTFWATQSYGIPLRKTKEDELTIQKIPTAYIGMSAQYSTFNKVYKDMDTHISERTDTNGEILVPEHDFYKNYYISKQGSKDSIAQSNLDLRFFIQLQPYNRDGLLGLLTGGIGNETGNYYSDSVTVDLVDKYGTGGGFGRNSTYLYGSAEGALKKYMRWGASLKYNLLGYRSSDITFKGNIQANAYIKERPLTLDASVQFSTTEPDVWVQGYFSNHFAWLNSFGKESSTTVKARLLFPSAGLEIGGDYQLVQNKIYYDSVSIPTQLGESMSIMGVYLQKNFALGGFRLNHRVLMQWSSNQEAVPVPAISAYLSYFYEFDVVQNVLRMELGIDGRFNTKYYGFGYNPALGKFYNQRETEIGNYPFLDAFMAAKWKRMRLLLKLQHFNANLLANKEYFLAQHFPANRMMFKIGVSWSFYN